MATREQHKNISEPHVLIITIISYLVFLFLAGSIGSLMVLSGPTGSNWTSKYELFAGTITLTVATVGAVLIASALGGRRWRETVCLIFGLIAATILLLHLVQWI